MDTIEPIADTDLPWLSIISKAQEVMENSWSPFSGFKVGAAALLQDGRMVTGTNIENGSYGLTLCAECSMVSDNVSNGRSIFVAIAVVGPDGEHCVPCGRCRAIMADHSDEDTLVMTPSGPVRLLGELLPYPFSY